MLSKMEELNLLENGKEWFVLRETRNVVIHEYPFVTEDIIVGLNLLNNHVKLIISICQRLEKYISTRFNIQ